jgi:hypothetical protein
MIWKVPAFFSDLSLNQSAQASSKSFPDICYIVPLRTEVVIVGRRILTPINLVLILSYHLCHLSESKGIELKAFSLNINYNTMSSVVVVYS